MFLGLDLAAWTQTIIGGIIGGLAGFLASLRANKSYHDWLAPILEMDVDKSDLAHKPTPPPGGLTYFHVVLSAPSKVPGWRGVLGDRRIPKGVSAKVKISDSRTHTILVDAPARWVSWPRPISLVSIQSGALTAPSSSITLSAYFDEQEAARLESRDFKPSREPEQLDLVVKMEGDPNIYFWNNWSYQPSGPQGLGPGTYDVRIMVHCEGKPWEWCFRVSNNGPSWANVGIERISCPKS